MQGYGAVQIGCHFFAKKGELGSKIAEFAHLPLGPISSFVRLEYPHARISRPSNLTESSA